MLSTCTAARSTSAKRSFTSLSALRRQATAGLVYTQIEDAGPCTGARRYNAVHNAVHDLGNAPRWRSGTTVAAADSINSAVAEALIDAHNVALQNQAAELRAEANARLAAATQEHNELLAAAQKETQSMRQELDAQRQELLQKLNDQAAVDTASATQSAGEEADRLRSQLASAHGLLRVAVLDKAYTEACTTELLSLPASALQGVGGKTAKALESIGIATVGDLAMWKVVGAANAACEAQDGGKPAVGLASCTAEAQALQALRLKTAADVAGCKFVAFAQALETMALEARVQQEDQ